MPRRPLAPALGALLCLTGSLACDTRPAAVDAAPGSTAPGPAAPGEIGPGVVAWESNRSGAWRIWRSDLRGRGAAALSPDEPGRQHCCPHIAPNGRRLVYLSLPPGRGEYLDEKAIGDLMLVDLATGGARRLASGARTYFEDRAAVWRDARTLHYIAEDGSVRALDVDDGDSRSVLAASGDLHQRWLVDASGRWAASGRAALAPIRGLGLGALTPLPGCQPYFSHDGTWALWTAGAGGPIDAWDLETGTASTILGKNDPRMAPGRGYAYFPMVSSDGTLFAYAASDGSHDHHRSDYDVFVAELEPATRSLLGRPWAVAPDPAVDRFPDVWRAPLELGRRAGAAPLALDLAAPDGGAWTWEVAGEVSVGPRLAASLAAPGTYEIVARSGDRRLDGVAVVQEPPAVPAWSARWPALGDGIVWSWAVGSRPATPLEGPRGAVDASRPLDLSRGAVVADATADLLWRRLQATNRFALDLDLTAYARSTPDLAAIVAVGRDRGHENLVLGQRGDHLTLRLRVGPRGRAAYSEIDLGALPIGRPVHVAVDYTPGRTTLYLDGRAAPTRYDLRGHFFQWQPFPLVLGDRRGGGAPWSGELRAIAVYDRLLDAEEARRNAAFAAQSR
jgi:Concanavalin A-like lectin/glucanases superfamily